MRSSILVHNEQAHQLHLLTEKKDEIGSLGGKNGRSEGEGNLYQFWEVEWAPNEGIWA